MQYASSGYTYTAMTLHWLLALLITLMFGIGWYMVELPQGPDRHFFFTLHKSIGLTVAGLVLLRFLWRLFHRPPPLPSHLKTWQRALAHLTHGGLYVAMFIQPLSGYISSSFSGYKTKFWGLPLPHWGWKDQVLNELFTEVHVVSSVVLVILITIHVLAALYHLALRKDDVFFRMLPRRRQPDIAMMETQPGLRAYPSAINRTD